jgi:hypothetical protein
MADAKSVVNSQGCTNSLDNTYVGCKATVANPSNDCCPNPGFSQNCVRETAQDKEPNDCG